jgi:hypothetical protein
MFSGLKQKLRLLSDNQSSRAKRSRKQTALWSENLESRLVQASTMSIGVNLEQVVDWSPAWTFTDAFKSSRPWISHAYNTATGQESWEGGGTVNVNAEGWPTGLNQWTNSSGQVIRQRLGTLMFRDIGTAYSAGIYRAEWEGSGTVSFGFAARVTEQGVTATGKNYALLNVTPSTDGIYMKIADMSSTNPVRNVHVWMPDYNGQSFAGQVWQPGAAFSPFHPAFLQKLAPFKTLRFMDWAETNSTDVTAWSQRRPYNYATQQSGDFRNGVALEYMIELCNTLDADAWFNMPYAADDMFVRNFATQVRDTLEPGRKINIEWSNELWNAGWGFEAYPWVTQQLALPENAYLGGDRWAFVARETKRDFDIWSDVFAGQTNRLTRVVAGQQANSWIAEQIATKMDGHFDAISCAAYMYVTDADRASFSASTTADQVLDALVRNIPQSAGWVQNHRNLANSLSTILGRPIGLLAYEGGPHLDGWNAAYQQAFFNAGNSTSMTDVYTQFLNATQNAGLQLLPHYNLTGGLYPTSFGAFGALQSMYQTIDTAPKYKAIVNFAGSTTPALPQISIETVIAAASETGPTSGTIRLTRTGATDQPLAISYTLGGTASAADYTGLPASISFAAGESTKLIQITPVDDTLVEGSEQLSITISASSVYTIDSARASSSINIADNDSANLAGLVGYYFDNSDFTGLKFTRRDGTIDFNWGTGSPDSRIGRDTFSVRWTGQMQAVEAGAYFLRSLSDDAIRVWVNGVLQIDNWRPHNATYNYSRAIYLAAGEKANIQVDYFENTNRAVMQLYWLRPSQTIYVAIPPSQLSSSASVMTESSSTGLQAMSIKPTGFIASPPVAETAGVKIPNKKAFFGNRRK